jgi:hypothetical protein
MSPPSPSLYKCVTNAKSCIQDHKKTEVPENPGNSGSTPTPCLDQPVLAQGGGGSTQQGHSTHCHGNSTATTNCSEPHMQRAQSLQHSCHLPWFFDTTLPVGRSGGCMCGLHFVGVLLQNVLSLEPGDRHCCSTRSVAHNVVQINGRLPRCQPVGWSQRLHVD